MHGSKVTLKLWLGERREQLNSDENEALEGGTTDDSKLSLSLTKVGAVEEIKEHRRLGTKVDNRRRSILITVSSKKASQSAGEGKTTHTNRWWTEQYLHQE